MSDDGSVLISCVGYFASRPNKVFDAWLDTEMIAKFMFGPHLRENEEILSLEIDPTVGGTFLFSVMRDGRKINHVGEYFEIKRPLRLTFSWGIDHLQSDSRVTIEFIGLGSGTQLTLHHSIPQKWADLADRTKEGWTKIINQLSEVIDQ